jgi:hypothetical protein
MKAPRIRTGSDGRPRVYLWPTEHGVEWSFGPTGQRRKAASAGAAVETSLDQLGRIPAVIIFDPQTASGLLAEHMGAAHG